MDTNVSEEYAAFIFRDKVNAVKMRPITVRKMFTISAHIN
jgi:hypothetical protein